MASDELGPISSYGRIRYKIQKEKANSLSVQVLEYKPVSLTDKIAVEVYVLPGNHDSLSYVPKTYYKGFITEGVVFQNLVTVRGATVVIRVKRKIKAFRQTKMESYGELQVPLQGVPIDRWSNLTNISSAEGEKPILNEGTDFKQMRKQEAQSLTSEFEKQIRKAAPQPPPRGKTATSTTLLAKPWRKLKENDPWTEAVYQSLKDEIATHENLKKANVEYFNILLLGQIGSGKSSFFNTVESVFGNFVTTKANAGSVTRSLTTQFRSYKVRARDKKNKSIKFRFCDCMGLQERDVGLNAGDVAKIMDGHVQDMTELSAGGLNPGQPGYNSSPTVNDKMHCVAFIVGADTVEFMDETIVNKIKAIRLLANQRSLNPVIILTQVDKYCDETANDIKNIYMSKDMQEKVKDVSDKFGITENMVFPVQNYSSQSEKELGIDILNLLALRQILRCSEQFLEDMVDRDDEMLRQTNKTRRSLMKQGGQGLKSVSEDGFKSDELSSSDYEQKEKEKKPVREHTRRSTTSTHSPSAAPSRVKEAPAVPERKVCRALKSYKSTDGDQLDMEKDDELFVVKENLEGGWTRVKNNMGQKGKVPTRYLDIGRKAAPPTKNCTALYSYDATDDDQLDMEEDDELVVMMENLEGGWTRVKNERGQEGKVPTNYLNIGGKAAPPESERKTRTANHPYESADSSDVDMEDGDELLLRKEALEGGWKNGKGQKGKVPASHLNIDQPPATSPTAAAAPKLIFSADQLKKGKKDLKKVKKETKVKTEETDLSKAIPSEEDLKEDLKKVKEETKVKTEESEKTDLVKAIDLRRVQQNPDEEDW